MCRAVRWVASIIIVSVCAPSAASCLRIRANASSGSRGPNDGRGSLADHGPWAQIMDIQEHFLALRPPVITLRLAALWGKPGQSLRLLIAQSKQIAHSAPHARGANCPTSRSIAPFMGPAPKPLRPASPNWPVSTANPIPNAPLAAGCPLMFQTTALNWCPPMAGIRRRIHRAHAALHRFCTVRIGHADDALRENGTACPSVLWRHIRADSASPDRIWPDAAVSPLTMRLPGQKHPPAVEIHSTRSRNCSNQWIV